MPSRSLVTNEVTRSFIILLLRVITAFMVAVYTDAVISQGHKPTALIVMPLIFVAWTVGMILTFFCFRELEKFFSEAKKEVPEHKKTWKEFWHIVPMWMLFCVLVAFYMWTPSWTIGLITFHISVRMSGTFTVRTIIREGGIIMLLVFVYAASI